MVKKEGAIRIFSTNREITVPVTRSTAGMCKCVALNALGMNKPGFVEVDVKCKFIADCRTLMPNFHVRTSPNFFDNQLTVGSKLFSSLYLKFYMVPIS